MMPIRKGDGTGLSVPGFTEVRKGDGTVLWSAGGEIPGSAVLNWPHDGGSGTTLEETVDTYGDQDGTISGATWAADSAWWEGQYLNYDGTDDYTQTGSWGNFGSTTLNGPITIILEARWPSGDDGYTIGMASGDQIFAIGVRSFITGDQQGQIGFFYRNAGGGDQRVFRTDQTFDDGNRHFVAIQIDSLDPSTGQIYVDSGYTPTSVSNQGTATGQDFGSDVIFGAIDATGANPSAVDLGRVLVTDSILSEPELDSIAQKHGFGP